MGIVALLSLLQGCTGEDPSPSTDDTGEPASDDTDVVTDDTDDSGTEPPPECGLVSGLSASATEVVLPADDIDVTVQDAGSGMSYAVTWGASGGTVDGDTTSATWTLDDTVATYGPEDAVLTATVEADGCATEVHEVTVSADWPDNERTVVIYNPTVKDSQSVAEYYAAFRDIPADAVCGVSSKETKVLAGDDLSTWIADYQACIDQVGNRVYYVVPVYGVPFEVDDVVKDIATGNKVKTSLDALMVFGSTTLDILDATDDGAIYNPIWLDGDSMAGQYDDYIPYRQLRPLIEGLEKKDPFDWRYYLVARIDGSSADAAKDLVDRSELAQNLADKGALDGIVYVDGRYGDTPPTSDAVGSYEYGEWNMWGTRYLWEDLDWYDVVWDGNDAEFGTAPAPTKCPDALYFAGWYGTPNNYNGCFEWAPGAIGGHLDSFSAHDVRAGSNWVHNALEAGITATFGAVEEPYVFGMPEYDQFFMYLSQGASYGEAAYESTLVSMWMMVWVGDPLYRPYAVE